MLEEGWRLWEVYSCEERNGNHLWVVELWDSAGVALRCEYCPVQVGDVFVVDYPELVYGNLNGITIKDGMHDATDEITIPVNVTFHVEKYTSMDSIGPEYDLWIELTIRGDQREGQQVPACRL